MLFEGFDLIVLCVYVFHLAIYQLVEFRVSDVGSETGQNNFLTWTSSPKTRHTADGQNPALPIRRNVP